MAFAQTPVIVQGNVTNSTTNQPVPNVAVIIQEAGGSYVDTVITDNNGNYVDTTTVITTQAGFMASITDCRGNTITSRGFSNPLLRTVVIDFDYCFTNTPICQATFTYTSPSQQVVVFRGAGTGGAGFFSYSWDFGDGMTGTGMTPAHTYANPGTYTVCLVIMDPTGCTDTTCQSVVVQGSTGGNCNANFTTRSITNRNTVNFADLSTPQGGAPGSTWQWDFGDGNSSTQQNPQHTYSRAGMYRVCLIYNVTTLAGACSDTFCTVVNVNANTPSACQAGFIYRARTNGWVQFSDFSRPNATATSISSWQWSFGDGTGSTAQNPRHQYAQSGTYRVCLIYSYQSSQMGPVCSDTLCRLIRVQVGTPNPCVALFTHRMTATGAIGFWALRSNTSTNNTYSWDFGDGNTGTGQNTMHTYAQNGTYTVCLIVNCGNGNADTTCRSITIGQNPTQSNIVGSIQTDPRVAADSAIVYLIALDSQAGTLTAVDSTYTNPNGNYSFANISPGDYRIKAALQPSHPLYSSRIPTYHANSLHWSFANVITVNGTPAVANIVLIAGNNPGGPGFIGGLISQGANKTGDPLENVSLILTDENDVAFTHTRTDANGEYSFGSLPYGTYRVYIEVVGKDYLYQTVSITAGSSSVTNVDFEVNEEYLTTSVDDILVDAGFGIAPNPASNELKVTFELIEASSYDIRVFNMMGQAVLVHNGPSTSGTQSATLNISELPNGFYTVQLTAGKQQLSKKLIVVK